jgi:hypothetical protein
MRENKAILILDDVLMVLQELHLLKISASTPLTGCFQQYYLQLLSPVNHNLLATSGFITEHE